MNTVCSARPRLPLLFGIGIAVLFGVRAAAMFTGLDRLPLIPSVLAEVIINDAALGLSKGHGLVGLSFEHSSLGLDRMYAHFPPVFLVIQSLVFRSFAVSPLTLRGLSAICDLAACALFLCVFYELYRQEILDRTGAGIAGILLLVDPAMLVQARQGRMESINICFGGLALYMCVRAGRSEKLELPLWLASSVITGIALATHISAILFWVAMAAWSALRFRWRGLPRWIAMNTIPFVLAGAIWFLTYGAKSVSALRQMHQIGLYSPKPSLGLGEFVAVFAGHAPGAAEGLAGPAAALILIFLCCGLFRLAMRPPPDSGAVSKWRRSLTCLSFVVLIQCCMLQFVLPASSINRVVMVTPFALTCAALALSHLRGTARRAAWPAGLVAVALQLAILTLYFGQLRHGWFERRPDRFDAILRALPANDRVVAVPELWFAFHERNRQMALLYPGLSENKYWENNPHAFDDYDAVILDPLEPDYRALLTKAMLDKPSARLFQTYRRDFMVVAKKLN